jgi:hypothetical protein
VKLSQMEDLHEVIDGKSLPNMLASIRESGA